MKKSISQAKYLTLAEAARLIPGRPHINTIRRWCSYPGFKGIVLKSWRFGNRRITDLSAIDAFMAATTGLQNPNPCRTSTSHQRAEAQLDAMGVTPNLKRPRRLGKMGVKTDFKKSERSDKGGGP